MAGKSLLLDTERMWEQLGPSFGEATLDPEHLPALRDQRGMWWVGTLIMAVGVCIDFALIPVIVGIFKDYIAHRAVWVAVILSQICLMPGTLLILCGLNSMVCRRQTRLSRDEVSRRERSLIGSRCWREPMSSYHGLLLRRESHYDSDNMPTDPTFDLWLVHPEESRWVLLSSGSTEREQLDFAKRWSNSLQLPLLARDEHGQLVPMALPPEPAASA